MNLAAPWIAAAVAALLLIGLLWLSFRAGRQSERTQRLLAEQAAELARQRIDALEADADDLQTRLRQTESAASEWRARFTAAQTRAQDSERWLEQLRGELGQQFRRLADEVLVERSAQASGQQDARLRDLLEPLRERLGEFSSQVRSAQLDQAERSGALSRQLGEMKSLHASLSREAVELSRALKGDRRLQGAWGEMVLERVLEASGLREGQEFHRQQVFSREDGSRPRPDVLVQLPGHRLLVIDAKCSLSAYERGHRASDESTREQAFAEHALAVRAHVDELARRDYAALMAHAAPELVLMFVPIEAAFLEALRKDPGLLEFALAREIALVTPSTLMLSLRSIAQLWQVERRDRNAGEIAERAGKLYDKFAGFVDDLLKVDEAMRRALRELDAAQAKLRLGPGNLLRQVEMLKELGARTSKSLPDNGEV